MKVFIIAAILGLLTSCSQSPDIDRIYQFMEFEKECKRFSEILKSKNVERFYYNTRRDGDFKKFQCEIVFNYNDTYYMGAFNEIELTKVLTLFYVIELINENDNN